MIDIDREVSDIWPTKRFTLLARKSQKNLCQNKEPQKVQS